MVLCNLDFNIFILTDFNNIVILSVVCHFYRNMHCSNNASNHNFVLLANMNKSMSFSLFV